MTVRVNFYMRLIIKFFPTIKPYMAEIFLTWGAKPRIGPLRSHAAVTSFQAARRPNGAFSSGSFCPEVRPRLLGSVLR